jgi:TPR repeat protein
MSVWVTIFAWMFFSGFVTTELAGTTHPGAAPGFWARACSLHEHNACVTWTGVLNAQCERGSGGACLQMASLTDSGLAVPRDPEAAGRGYGRACDLGDPAACQSFLSFVARGGSTALDHACRSGDPYSCFYLATVLNAGRAIPRDPPRALALFQSACTYGYDRGCGAAGQMYLAGQGTVPSASLALTNFERACTSGWGQSCADAANLYRNGSTGSFDSTRANQLLARACELSYDPACSTLYTH